MLSILDSVLITGSTDVTGVCVDGTCSVLGIFNTVSLTSVTSFSVEGILIFSAFGTLTLSTLGSTFGVETLFSVSKLLFSLFTSFILTPTILIIN